MILLCESCQARFRVNDAALGEAGRIVRCSRCDHQWFATPQPAGEEPAKEEPAIDEFVYHASLAKRKTSGKYVKSESERDESMAETKRIEEYTGSLWRLFLEEWSKSPRWFKWVSLAVTVIAFVSTYIGHSSILVRHIPQAYAPFGVYCADDLTLEEQQILYDGDNDTIQSEDTRFTIQGLIVNRSNKVKHAPKLRLALLDLNAKELGAQTLDLGDTWISPGQSIPLYHKLSYPSKAPTSIEISIGNRFELWFR
jgi:predicted Zn finger-like uncharacterized protein